MSSKTLVINRKYNGLYQKKSQQRVLKTYLKKKIPLKILDLSVLLLYPWKFQKNKVSPLVPILIPMEILCYFCLISPGNANSLLFNPTLEFSNAISPITLEIPCPQPATLQPPTPCLGFFGNSPKKIVKSRLLFKKMADFTGKLKQNFKYLQCKVFKMLLMKH